MPNLADLHTDIREFLETQVRSGSAEVEKLPDSAAEVYADYAETRTIAAVARAALKDIVDLYQSEQRLWPATTDCDRLDAAFLELESIGIVARQNFWCCQTCGFSAMEDEVEECRTRGQCVRGFTFYHEQDTERAVKGEGLYLSYCDVEGKEEEQAKIGREIQEVLEANGLTTVWDGSVSQRILVKLDWKRRQAEV